MAASEDDENEDFEEEDENVQKNPERNQNTKIDGESEQIGTIEDPDNPNPEDYYQEEHTGIFNPEIDQILWKREKIKEDDTRTLEYLVKYKEYSYLHCDWIEESDLLATGKNIKNKLNRFNKTFEKRAMDIVFFQFFFVT